MTCIDDAMWTILDIFDDIFMNLYLILLAIEMDDIPALLAPPPSQNFDPCKPLDNSKNFTMSFIRSPSPSGLPIPSVEIVENSMNLDAYFSVTRNNVDFSKACSLIKHDPTSYVEAKLLHQLNLSIHFHEQEIIRIREKAQQVITKHFTRPVTIDEHAYLVNKYERRQAKTDAQRRGLRRPYARKPYYPVSPSSQSSSSSASSPSIDRNHTIPQQPSSSELSCR